MVAAFSTVLCYNGYNYKNARNIRYAFDNLFEF